MSPTEKLITTVALVNAALFYAITIAVFLIAAKTRLNIALAAQKTAWLGIVLFIALPSFLAFMPLLQPTARMFLWCSLSFITWWVLFEVYRQNWRGNFREFLVFASSQIAWAVRYIRCRFQERCDVGTIEPPESLDKR